MGQDTTGPMLPSQCSRALRTPPACHPSLLPPRLPQGIAPQHHIVFSLHDQKNRKFTLPLYKYIQVRWGTPHPNYNKQNRPSIDQFTAGI